MPWVLLAVSVLRVFCRDRSPAERAVKRREEIEQRRRVDDEIRFFPRPRIRPDTCLASWGTESKGYVKATWLGSELMVMTLYGQTNIFRVMYLHERELPLFRGARPPVVAPSLQSRCDGGNAQVRVVSAPSQIRRASWRHVLFPSCRGMWEDTLTHLLGQCAQPSQRVGGVWRPRNDPGETRTRLNSFHGWYRTHGRSALNTEQVERKQLLIYRAKKHTRSVHTHRYLDRNTRTGGCLHLQ